MLEIGTTMVLLAATYGGNAEAHRRDFPFTTDWKQPSKGEVELESHSSYKGENDEFEQKFELEYGVTDRLSVAPYVVFERERGGSLKYHEWKFETRYQLGKYKTGRILPGLYLEYAHERGEDGEKDEKELEGKLIFSRYDKHGGDLTLNLIAEKVLNSDDDEGWEKSYSLGYARDLGHNKYQTRGGFEWIHNLDSRRINAGPVLSFAPTDNVWVSMGAVMPINQRGEGNRTELRLVAEYEF
jgi:hypothetical protein